MKADKRTELGREILVQFRLAIEACESGNVEAKLKAEQKHSKILNELIANV